MKSFSFKPLHLRDLKALIKASGFEIRQISGSHYGLYNPEGKFLYTVPVTHGQGKKDMVKPIYVKNVLKIIEEES